MWEGSVWDVLASVVRLFSTDDPLDIKLSSVVRCFSIDNSSQAVGVEARKKGSIEGFYTFILFIVWLKLTLENYYLFQNQII